MVRQLWGVFERYAERRLRLERPVPPPVPLGSAAVAETAAGADPASGFGLTITRHAIDAGRVVIEGRAPCGPVTLRRGAIERRAIARPGLIGADLARPEAARPDPADPDIPTPPAPAPPAPAAPAPAAPAPDLAPSDPAGPGMGRFTLSVPPGPGATEITARGARIVLPEVPRWRLRLARAALVPHFAATVAGTAPLIWRWLARRDALARRLVRDRLGLGPREVAGDLDAAAGPPQSATQAAPQDSPEPAPKPVTDRPVWVVLPVYDGLAMLRETLDRAVRHADVPLRVLVIDDASPDPAVAPFLAAFAAAHAEVEVLSNARNLGFIGSVNRGFARACAVDAAAPVVLLNSDAYVPPGWLGRLVAPLAGPDGTFDGPSDVAAGMTAGVASVTPMSNDAELMSVPVICAGADLPGGAGDALDAVAQGLSAMPVELPTGVGFCMALSPRFLAQVPQFDTAFGRGYGEEVDWCQRTAALGGRHLGLPTLFVEHRGGASFGSAAKARLLAENGARISARWPGFDRDVRAVLATDPLLTPRLALGLALAAYRAGPEPVAVYLAHTMGGGAEIDLARRLAADGARIGAAVVLRLGSERRWQIELVTPAGRTLGRTDDTALMRRLLHLLPRRRMIYSCAVGCEAPDAVPGLMLELAGDTPPEVLVHDYFSLSPSFTLQDADGVYRGLPDPATRDPAHRLRRADGSAMSLADWRAAWAPLMAQAGRIETFCPSAAALVAAAYPQATVAIVVRPHAPLWTPAVMPVAPDRDGPPRLGILGNIGQPKGAALLAPLALALARRGWPPLVVLGEIDPAHALPRRLAHIHGAYEHAEIPTLIARHRLTHWLIPSVWPETFSFTTQEALATGLPVWCFDLGGQADQIRAARAAGAAGGLIPLDAGRADLEGWLDGLAAEANDSGANDSGANDSGAGAAGTSDAGTDDAGKDAAGKDAAGGPRREAVS